MAAVTRHRFSPRGQWFFALRLCGVSPARRSGAARYKPPLTVGPPRHLQSQWGACALATPLLLFAPLTSHVTPGGLLLMRVHNEAPLCVRAGPWAFSRWLTRLMTVMSPRRGPEPAADTRPHSPALQSVAQVKATLHFVARFSLTIMKNRNIGCENQQGAEQHCPPPTPAPHSDSNHNKRGFLRSLHNQKIS